MEINKVVPSKNVNNIREMIDRIEKYVYDRPALTMRSGNGYKQLNYGQFKETVKALANGLLKIGIQKGDHIGLISENRNEWILAYLAVTYIGGIIVPLDKNLNQDELGHIIRSGEVEVVFVSDRYEDKLKNSLKYDKKISKIIHFDFVDLFINKDSNSIIKKILNKQEKINLKNHWINIADKALNKKIACDNLKNIYFHMIIYMGKKLLISDKCLYDDVKIDNDDTAAIIYTSGTTGLPKGVMLSHNNLVSDGDAIQQTTKAHKDDNWLIVLPLHHTLPAICANFVAILNYSNVTTVASLRPDIMIKIMRDTKVTIFTTVPLIVEKMYKNILSEVKVKPIYVRIMFKLLYFISFVFYKYFDKEIGKNLFPNIRKKLGMDNFRFFICGGGKISPDIIMGMTVLGINIYEGYGLTETSPVVSSGVPAHHRVSSVGLPLVNVDVKINNPNDDGNGEILVKGPNVMKGYYRQPKETEKVFDKDGWFYTGDIGYIDKDGYLYITGRLKNIIVTKGGKNVYPEEIEKYMLKSEYIDEAIIIGRKIDKTKEIPYAVIHPNMEAISAYEAEYKKNMTNEQIEKFIQKEISKKLENISHYKRPKDFEISYEELPKTSTNKIKRYLFEK